MDIVKEILGLILGPVFILFPVWMGRRKSVPNFSYWMKTEGAPILGQLFVLIVILISAQILLALLLR
jgi:hypothetical protein